MYPNFSLIILAWNFAHALTGFAREIDLIYFGKNPSYGEGDPAVDYVAIKAQRAHGKAAAMYLSSRMPQPLHEECAYVGRWSPSSFLMSH